MPLFQHTAYLLFLFAIPLLVLGYILLLQWKKKTQKKIGDERLVKELIKNYSPKKHRIKFILLIIAFIAGCFALANPRSKEGTEKVNRNGIDVMIALDVSKSMLATDINPSRLERAKQVVSKLIDRLSNDRIGIVIFAGRAYLQMPLTGDHGAAKMYLTAANVDAVPTQGTVIADALKMCGMAFNKAEKKYKAIVLISDGEDHDEAATKTAAELSEEGIMICTIGIGSPEGATLVDATTNEVKKDNDGNVVVSKLNEEELKNIAEKGNGIYQIFNNTEEVVGKLDQQLNSMDQRTVTEDSLVNYKTFFQWLLIPALLLLIIEFFVSENIGNSFQLPGFLKRNKNKEHITSHIKSFFVFLLLSTSLSSALFAQKTNSIIKKGNDAYNKQDFDKAAVQYQEAISKNPADEAAQFNLGNALYKGYKTEEAIQAYNNAIQVSKKKEAKSEAYYNKGVVLQNGKKLPECIDAYKNALKLNAGDDDARQNLQKALQQLKEQQKQEQQKKNKPKEDQQQKNKEKPKDQEEKNNQPQPQPSKLTKQDAEEKLKALLQQEKNLQDKLRKVKSGDPKRPEKDW
ncbi:MAG: VWA domain-containing protein [Chitinophagaceae bacterium]